MPRQFNESRTKRPTLNAAPRLVLKPYHSERGRLPRRSYGEGGRNLLLLTAAYTDFPRRISSAYWRPNRGQLFSCSFATQKAATAVKRDGSLQGTVVCIDLLLVNNPRHRFDKRRRHRE